MIRRYKIEKHDEPFPGFPSDCVYSVSERCKGTNQYAIVYEAMLTEEQAKKAVEALKYADKHHMNDDPDDLAVFLETAIWG